MSNPNKGRWIDLIDKDLLKDLKTTEEYKAWQESLFAILGYSDEEPDDENLVLKLWADHLNASFELQKGLENARHKKKKMLKDDWLLDNSGQ
ncbi:MAG: hypothetical protein ABFC91_02405 [Methanobacteriaceae archaeon]